MQGDTLFSNGNVSNVGIALAEPEKTDYIENQTYGSLSGSSNPGEKRKRLFFN